MAKPLVVSFGGVTASFAVTLVDRSKIYGSRKRVAIDAQGRDCTRAALSSDGATRLLVTAYIGIGNKLFARGSGPGLSWEKGVPLHFVSIGKWRWDTPDATGPVQIKLYKNDQVECASLGTLELEPGHQHEVTATF